MHGDCPDQEQSIFWIEGARCYWTVTWIPFFTDDSTASGRGVVEHHAPGFYTWLCGDFPDQERGSVGWKAYTVTESIPGCPFFSGKKSR